MPTMPMILVKVDDLLRSSGIGLVRPIVKRLSDMASQNTGVTVEIGYGAGDLEYTVVAPRG